MEDLLEDVSIFTKAPSYGLLNNTDYHSSDWRGIGRYSKTQRQATFFGENANAQSQGATAFGALARALDVGATAIGYAALASGRYSVAVGDQAAATKFRAIAIGRQANAAGIQSVSIGYRVNASGQDSIAIGANAVASGVQSVHVGNSGMTSGDRATSIGHGVTNSGDDATLVGQGSVISGDRSTAVGQGNNIAHADCVIVGKGGTTTAIGQVLIGTASTVFTDVFLGRGQAHTGAAGALKVRTAAGSGSNVAGDDMHLIPGEGTGTGEGGVFRIYRTPAGASGSSLNTAVPHVVALPSGVVFVTAHSSGSLPTGISGTSFVLGPNAGVSAAGLVLATTVDGNAHLGTVFISTTLGYMAVSSTRQGSANGIPLTFWTHQNGVGGTAVRGIDIADGMAVNSAAGAAPSGGTLGFGTINVISGIYLNNTVYNNPDYVFEKHFTGKMDKTKDRPGAKDYPGLMPLDEIETAVRTKFRLPLLDATLANARAAKKKQRIDDIEALRGKTLLDIHGNPYTIPNQELNQRRAAIEATRVEDMGDDMFDRADAILAQFEEITLHVIDLHKRLKVLEAQ